MKTLKVVVFTMIVSTSLNTQAKNELVSQATGDFIQTNRDTKGLAGDNLDLSSVLNIFKQSKNVEEFEKNLNAADTKVNNLDLNQDGQVDYIRVIESGNDSLHNLVLQVPISQSESQDVAVIQLLKKNDKTVHVQIVGDETLYGKNYIIEPQNNNNQAQLKSANKPTQAQQINSNSDDIYYQPTTPPPYSDANVNSGYNSNNFVINNDYNNQQPYSYINVWGWPSVSYMFSPSYSYYVSPWYWGYYPRWWNPWSPFGPYAYHQRMMGYGYYGYYHRANYNRMGGAYSGYYNRGRVNSSYVQRTRNNPGSYYGHRVYGGFRSTGNQRSYNGQRQQQGGNRQNNGGSNMGNRNNGGYHNSGGNRNYGGQNNGGNHGGGYNGGGHMNGGGGHGGGGHGHR